MTYAWLEAGRPIVHGPWSLPTGARAADAPGSFLFIVWAVNTRMLFASSWGKVKLALGTWHLGVRHAMNKTCFLLLILIASSTQLFQLPSTRSSQSVCLKFKKTICLSQTRIKQNQYDFR